MSIMYIANCTTHEQVVNFTIPERVGVLTCNVGAGKQTPILGSTQMTDLEIKYVVDQLRKYGLKSIQESAADNKTSTPFLYSVDKPITTIAIQTVFNTNKQLKSVEGALLRKAAAVSASQTFSNIVNDETDLEVTITEDSDGKLSGDDDRIEERMIVTQNPENNSMVNRQKGKGRNIRS